MRLCLIMLGLALTGCPSSGTSRDGGQEEDDAKPARRDLGTDIGMDAGTDAPTLHEDPEPEHWPPAPYGKACVSTDDCDRGLVCEPEQTWVLGHEADPVMNLPEEGRPLVVRMADGICTAVGLHPADADDACDTSPDGVDCESARCARFEDESMCVRPCNEYAIRSGCRDGYVCHDGGCLPTGCSSDVECRVIREETNGIPGMQTPALCGHYPERCGDDARGFDHLVYDPESPATCNPSTFACDTPPTASVQAGDRCAANAECGPGGFCEAERRLCSTNPAVQCTQDNHCTAHITGSDADGVCAPARYPGGSCTRWDCDVEGQACNLDGVCEIELEQDGSTFPRHACRASCTLGGAAFDDLATWIEPNIGQGGCRAGYRCVWNQRDAYGEPHNGWCTPGEYNERVVPNVGEPCRIAADCWSPFGRAWCVKEAGASIGWCSVRDCSAPDFEVPATSCGPMNECINVGGAEHVNMLCFHECTSPADCEGEGVGCLPLTATETNYCFPLCLEDIHCQSGWVCERVGTLPGKCVPE